MTAPTRRGLTHVAVGVLLRTDGCVLLADRPRGKPYAGYWEFPGGKIEEGEPVCRALERELHEELGIEIAGSAPWVTFEYDYPHAQVRLQFRIVRRWRGEPHPREGQRLCFVDPAGPSPQPLLPAAVPALRWLLLPRSIQVGAKQETSTGAASNARGTATPESMPSLVVEAGCDRLGDGSSRESDSAEIRARAGRVETESAAGDIAGAIYLAASGHEGTHWKGAWVDSKHDLQRAAREGCDFALVRSTRLAERLKVSPGPLPAYVPVNRLPTCDAPDAVGASSHWIELHRTDCDFAD